METTASFAGQVALITGGAAGIGRATAQLFAQRGARVMVADRDLPGAQATVDLITAAGGQARAAAVDVADEAQVEALLAATLAAYGRLDLAVNNAGIEGGFHPTGTYPTAEWQQVLAVNLTGLFYCLRAEIQAMQAQGGAIVNVASVAGLSGFPQHAAYCASKHGVIGLTKTAALEYARAGLRINAVCPGFTETRMVTDAIAQVPDMARRMTRAIPLRRLGQPEEIAQAIAWLCSADASFTIGHPLVLDGGMEAQ